MSEDIDVALLKRQEKADAIVSFVLSTILSAERANNQKEGE